MQTRAEKKANRYNLPALPLADAKAEGRCPLRSPMTALTRFMKWREKDWAWVVIGYKDDDKKTARMTGGEQ